MWFPINTLALRHNLSAFLPNLLFTILCLTPFFVPSFYTAGWPQLGFSALYFWAIHSPERLKLGLVFGVTLLQDSLWAMPLGVMGCTYLISWFCIQLYRRFIHKTSFSMTWVSFGILYFMILMFKEVLMISLDRPWFEATLFLEFLLAFFSYPAVAALNYGVYQKMI